jgi:vanillate O-demethylase ferredoxin subunit
MTDLKLRIVRKIVEADDIYSFELRSDDGRPLPAFAAGSHIDIKTPAGPVRQYSLCNNPSERDRYHIAVLRDPASRGGSRSLADEVNEGDLVEVSQPRNHFPLHQAQESLLLAGGNRRHPDPMHGRAPAGHRLGLRLALLRSIGPKDGVS